MKEFLEWLLKLLATLGGGPVKPPPPTEDCFTREAATAEVEKLYVEIHGRSMGPDGVSFVDSLVNCDETVESVDVLIRESTEHRTRSESTVRGLFVEVLRRDPGPKVPEGAWLTGGSTTGADNGALGYVRDFQLGNKTAEDIRAELLGSEEHKKLPQVPEAAAFEVNGTHINEPGQDQLGRHMPLSISFFYALSTGIPRGRFVETVDNLAGKVQEARLSMSTFTWGNPVGEPEVVPFKTGTLHEGHSNRLDPNFLREMIWRVDYMLASGIRPQITVFWGGFQPLFKDGDDVRDSAMKKFLTDLITPFKGYPVKWEIMNEADHGHHLNFVGISRRRQIIRDMIRHAKGIDPDSHWGVSDGGHPPHEFLDERKTAWIVESKEHGGHVLTVPHKPKEILFDANGEPKRPTKNKGAHYFDYHAIAELDDWKVHFPRDMVEVGGIPRWCRGLWHLNGESFEFQKHHPGKGYGQNDENVFHQMPDDVREWHRPSSHDPTDWRMVGLMAYVSATARSCTTYHTHKGFFCRPGAGSDPVIDKVAPAFAGALEGFQHQGQVSFNTGWTGSPVTEYSGAYKCHILRSGDGRDMLIVVLNPNQGSLALKVDKAYTAEIREITGEIVRITDIPSGTSRLSLPAMSWDHAAIIRLRAK